MTRLIYDIGMHTGEDTHFYLKKGFNVVAVEANPDLAKRARKRFKSEIAAGRLVVVDRAIAPRNSSEIEFFINKDKDDWGTISPDWNRSMNSNYTSIKVKTIQLEEIVQTYGVPYYLKIDIEGAEVLCLKSLLNLGVTPAFLSLELMSFNNLANTKVDCLETVAHLRVLGYRKFKISDQIKNMTVRCPNPPLEGEYVDYRFGSFSSGPFGKEIVGSVYSLDEVATMYLDYFYQRNRIEPTEFDPKSWYDIHAIRD